MIRVENLTVQAGPFRLEDLSFQLPEGCYATLMGRTGCGKTTLLEALCGLKKVLRGHIWMEDREVTRLRPGERDIGFVPQDVALFSSMTVYEHLAFGPRIRRLPRARARTERIAESLGLTPLLKRRPVGLSGGERQRVALGRALSIEPRILCLDEPLSALDDSTHAEMCALLRRVHAEYRVTALHITHRQQETEHLADLRLQLEDGLLTVVT